MATTINANVNEEWLTKAQYDAKKQAGTLEVGKKYHIKGKVIEVNNTAPTTSTSATNVGQFYLNTTDNKLYICTAISGSTYTWNEVNASEIDDNNASANTTYSSNKINTLINDIQTATPVIEDTTTTSYTLNPNTFYVMGSRDGATLSLALGTETANVLNEYMFEIVADESSLSMSTPSEIRWAENGHITNTNNTLTFEAKYTYQASIVRNLGIIIAWENGTLATPVLSLHNGNNDTSK